MQGALLLGASLAELCPARLSGSPRLKLSLVAHNDLILWWFSLERVFTFCFLWAGRDRLQNLVVVMKDLRVTLMFFFFNCAGFVYRCLAPKRKAC